MCMHDFTSFQKLIAKTKILKRNFFLRDVLNAPKLKGKNGSAQSIRNALSYATLNLLNVL